MTQVLELDVRKTKRSRCRIPSRVRHLSQEADGRILNVSRTGLAIELYNKLHASTGSTVVIENDEIGLLEGVVRWNRSGRLGIVIAQNSNSMAKIDAYFRHFHKEVQPVLKR
ncbi:PilZ domain-containing protein [Peteryoungia desertarenae]|uniref:PilZ domain-containing protein n=1 Tax=Peteryoungia desertarenae TaxID=1813451 RepID=A0ABX6QNX4_9HYPH|nr:PilZ domain-containing protein [Peteryoungia desertarenae]QLF70266.1 PilZ domain-containing protein [Peteryoungia desertarenae]